MTSPERPHPGSEHLIIVPEREAADTVAEELREEGFDHVRVVHEPGISEQGLGEWAVYVLDTRLPDTAGGGAYEGLRERFIETARRSGGRYDQPGDHRPPIS